MEKINYSGSSMNPYGLHAADSYFINNTSRPLVLQYELATKLNTAITQAQDHFYIYSQKGALTNKHATYTANGESLPIVDWKPIITAGYSGEMYDAANVVILNTKGLTSLHTSIIGAKLADAGLRYNVEESSIRIENVTDLSSSTIAEFLKRDRAAFNDELLKNRLDRAEMKATYNDTSASSYLSAHSTSTNLPIFNAMAMATFAGDKIALLDSAITGKERVVLQTKSLAGDAARNSVNASAGQHRDGYQPDKKERHVYKNKSFLGSDSKLNVPASFKLFSSKAKNNDLDVSVIDCFLLRSVNAINEEKFFVFQSLSGEAITYFFGNKPSIYSFQGLLYDTYNQQWYNDFLYYYDNYLRGSAALKNNLRMVLSYEDQILEGLLLNMKTSKSSDMPDGVNITFDMVLVSRSQSEGYEDPVSRGKTTELLSISDYKSTHNNTLLNKNLNVTLTSAKSSPAAGAVALTPSDLGPDAEVLLNSSGSSIGATTEAPLGKSDSVEDMVAAAQNVGDTTVVVTDKSVTAQASSQKQDEKLSYHREIALTALQEKYDERDAALYAGNKSLADIYTRQLNGWIASHPGVIIQK